MKQILEFLLKVNQLKTMPRSGWVWLGVEKPETIAEHSFSVAMTAWLLAHLKKRLNLKKVIKIAISHDLCEVYAGDLTAYYGLLPEDPEKRKEVLKRWIRLPQKEKERRAKEKFKIEKKALLKLIKSLEPKVKKEILLSFFSYEEKISKEGEFVKQIDKVEPLLQSIVYFGAGQGTPVVSWWEEAEEAVEDPLLLDFLKIVEKYFYRKKRIYLNRDERKLKDILVFILEIFKLKKLPRKGWVIRGVKDPETMGSHIFILTLMAWFFGQEQKPKLNMEKLLKMALCHELCEIYAGDETPYDFILLKRKNSREVFEKWIRLTKKEKEKMFLKDYKKEKAALKKLTLRLPSELKNETLLIFDEFKKKVTPEARFLNQLYVMATLLQALLYWRENKKFPIAAWWEWAYESSDSQMNFEFMEELKREFYREN